MDILLSIITVAYNAGQTIEKTIQSVKKNKDESIEYIVVDGGSTDDTIDVLEKYKAVIDILIREKDDGMYDALNKGIKVATGKYVMLLAADDRLIDGVLPEALKSIGSLSDVWCGSVIQKTEYGFFYEKSDPDLSQLKFHCSLRHPATIFKKETFEKYGFYDTHYKCSGDRELFLRFYLKGAVFQIVERPLVIFGMGGMSTNDRTRLAIPEGIKITKQYGLLDDMSMHLYKKMIRREKIKVSMKKNMLFKKVLYILYTDVIYAVICKLSDKENNKLSKTMLKSLNLVEEY